MNPNAFEITEMQVRLTVVACNCFHGNGNAPRVRARNVRAAGAHESPLRESAAAARSYHSALTTTATGLR
jgi:hypothetical protein